MTRRGNPNRASDYVADVDRWSYHAKSWLDQAADPAISEADRSALLVNAVEALAKASDAIKRAVLYICTGVEQTAPKGE